VKEQTFPWASLAAFALDRLPRYAVPIFLRLAPKLQVTGTLKMQKGKMRGEGCDLAKIEGDKMYWLKPGADSYVPFEMSDWEAVKAGDVKL